MADEPGGLTAEHPLARALVTTAPAGWQRVDGVFSITVAGEISRLVYSIGEQAMSVDPPEVVVALVRELRAIAAESSAGPWWRLLVTMTSSGEIEAAYDYGDEPFPDGQLFVPEAYRADLEAYPRDKVPVWLAAYIGHDDRQRRTPQQAAAQARADRSEQVWAVLAENEFPPFPQMWTRWTTIAAAFVAAKSDWGPRMLPWVGLFEGTARGGSTLHVLPGGRAVLSGGVWNAPTLDAVYNGGAPMPELYGGAPEWVADPVLNPRAASGLLSFCYWWEAGRWYRGQSPAAHECAPAVPGMWTRDTAIGIVASILADSKGKDAPDAIRALMSAAEAGVVTRKTLVAVFGDDGRFDIDGALYQYSVAGLMSTVPEPMPAEQAISRVRDYITGRQLDTTGYPLAQLTAERFSVGWMVHVPAPAVAPASARAIFYVADDGTFEQSSSSVPPAEFTAAFERRFQQRHGSAG
ncbi:hypothetical protein OHA40_15845 [Nocardia sp. NBC_00508]|uniref:hypothetical protein n=1 Tax=Nocardia sp. NBC_00508 TaxID=2975992 RepID=UPI002E81DCC8|nr:hypothetical protein [Nocardia sp. NBC_00508]WUD69458.1 hypothetical protein OHA40_15845 [Nocardia sp. NBC_00508]